MDKTSEQIIYEAYTAEDINEQEFKRVLIERLMQSIIILSRLDDTKNMHILIDIAESYQQEGKNEIVIT